MQRPDLAPGQEWVWDYPRPPRLERSTQRIRIEFGGTVVADTTRALRILETSHPPVYYIPPDHIAPGALVAAAGTSFCEWKGSASYLDVVAGSRTYARVAWAYASPNRRYEEIRGYVAFYPGAADACFVDDERVRAQPGDFYGGWITDAIVGPFKGGAGTTGW